MKIGLVPLDERPCNQLFPRMIGDIAGVSVITPPASALGRGRSPGRYDELAAWLRQHMGSWDALIISVDQLVHGGLVPSRLTHCPEPECLARLALIKELRQRWPEIPIWGFSVIMRIPNYDLAVEEPAYWSHYGTLLFSYSQAVDAASSQADPAAVVEKSRLESMVPGDVLRDFLWRRGRNHRVNAAAVDLVAEGYLDELLLTLDDTSARGLARMERQRLEERVHALGVSDKVHIHPGADEVACLLVSRVILRHFHRQPRYFVRFGSEERAAQVARYEDRPIRDSVERQIRSSGGRLAASPADADILLYVNTPRGPQGEAWNQVPSSGIEGQEAEELLGLVRDLKEQQQRGKIVSVADLAYANGADMALVQLLQDHDCVLDLAAYGGWNTASNALGTVTAQANARWLAVAVLPPDSCRDAAHFQFLLLRFVEDWLYQVVVRTELRARVKNQFDLGPELPAAEAYVRGRMAELTQAFMNRCVLHRDIPGQPGRRIRRWELRNVRLPWNRAFEIGCEVYVAIG